MEFLKWGKTDSYLKVEFGFNYIYYKRTNY